EPLEAAGDCSGDLGQLAGCAQQWRRLAICALRTWKQTLAGRPRWRRWRWGRHGPGRKAAAGRRHEAAAGLGQIWLRRPGCCWRWRCGGQMAVRSRVAEVASGWCVHAAGARARKAVRSWELGALRPGEPAEAVRLWRTALASSCAAGSVLMWPQVREAGEARLDLRKQSRWRMRLVQGGAMQIRMAIVRWLGVQGGKQRLLCRVLLVRVEGSCVCCSASGGVLGPIKGPKDCEGEEIHCVSPYCSTVYDISFSSYSSSLEL
ncbi:hypothetical protein Taro_003469, partial [Colocasia esculenta]|nr:hypothetical protein [Colocasia esculenta]